MEEKFNNCINSDLGCNLCKVKLIKSKGIHLNSVKHKKNLFKYIKANLMNKEDLEEMIIKYDLQKYYY